MSKSSSPQQVVISPRDFIREPYVTCPFCGKESFGVLMVRSDSYVRRCAKCFRPHGHEEAAAYPLPPLNKKVIYIDQMGVSNMMKALRPSTPSAHVKRIPGFWLEMFDRLDVLIKLNLIVCPESRFHEEESLLTFDFELLRNMYEHLSCGVSFCDADTVERFQIAERLDLWLGDRSRPSFDIHDFVDGEINAWLKKHRFGTHRWRPPELIREHRENRRKADDHLAGVFGRWRGETNRSFDDWFEEERRSTVNVLSECFRNYLRKALHMAVGLASFDPFDFLPDGPTEIVLEIQERLRKAGREGDELTKAMGEFLRSEAFLDTPHIRIRSLIHAALAKQSALGRKKPLGGSYHTDTRLISTLLPYCDAMFLDDEMRTVLTQEPVRQRLGYGTRIFSAATHRDFFKYLDEIKAGASESHLRAVDEVYGPDWAKPYREIHDQERSS